MTYIYVYKYVCERSSSIYIHLYVDQYVYLIYKLIQFDHTISQSQIREKKR